MLVGVRMQLLRLPAEGALDLRSARGLRYPKNIVGVTHPHSLPGKSPLSCKYRPNRIDSMWWARAYTAMRAGRVQQGPPSPAAVVAAFALAAFKQWCVQGRLVLFWPPVGTRRP